MYRITLDSIERQIAFGVSQYYPLVIIFGIDSTSILAQWRHEAFALSGAAALGILMILGLTWWLLRHIAAEERIQNVLRDSERRLRESQRIAGIGHFERDVGAEQTRWADNMYELHGVTPAQYPDGRDALRALVHPEDRASMLASFKAKGEAALKPGMAERRIIRPDGDVRIIRYEWRPIEGSEGKERLFGVAQDLTAIRQAEAALRWNEQQLRDLLDCSSDFIWETNADGIMTLLAGQNGDLFRHSLGRPGSEVEAVELEQISPDLQTLRDAIQARETFRNLVVPLRIVTGEVRWIRSSGKPLFDTEGVFLGYRGAGADVTETLRQRQIDEHRRKAEALGRLASGIAHEINNLLQPIIIYATFGNGDDQANAGQKRYFARIARAAEAATLIVRNVLSFARERPPHREAVLLADAVRETLDLLGDALPNRVTGATLPIDEDCIVDVDRSGLAQALTNLITNAAEAMTNGGVITISARNIYLRADEAQAVGIASGTYCLLSVADTGAGIPQDQIDKVFDPFFTTKPQGRGTGLGLSVVAGLAKSWGGMATVASTLGSGTVFTLYMPLARAQMVAAQ